MQSGTVQQWLDIIKDKAQNVTKKYTAIFQLRQFENIEGAKALIEGFPFLSESELLQHEVTYALGQMKLDDNEEVKQFLQNCFEDAKQYPVVRHEAGEGLSNFSGFFDFVPLFQKYVDCDIEEVRDTAILALNKAQTYQECKERYGIDYHGTKEPAAPLNQQEIEGLLGEQLAQGQEVQYSQKIFEFIKKEETSLWNKYRALYFLRNLAEKQQSKEIVKIIADLTIVPGMNNLFKHEIFFVLGQVGHLGQLIEDIVAGVISNAQENHIVRHEAISAFQSVSKNREFMVKFLQDPAPIVRESAIVAYEMIEYWNE